MSSELRLLEDRRAVLRYLESSTRPWTELHYRVGELLLDLGRQPDGPGLVASNRAVLDGDVHDSRMWSGVAVAIYCDPTSRAPRAPVSWTSARDRSAVS